MELAPGLGLSRLIVDLVQTGSTLRANGLVETEVIAHVTARLIVNRTALKTQPEAIGAWIAPFPRGAGGMIRLAHRRRRASRPRFAAPADQARETTESVDQAVAAIIADVRAEGDAALLRLHRAVRPPDADRRAAAHHRRRDRCGGRRASRRTLMAALDLAATRIEAFHRAADPDRSADDATRRA